MLTLLNIACYPDSLLEYCDASDFEQSYHKYGCDGVEMIYVGKDEREIITPHSIVGLHMSFYPYWIDLWNGNRQALRKEFGSEEIVESFYGGKERSALIQQFKTDLERARILGARYVVFHVSNTSIAEVYSYQMEHTDEEIIDASAELINTLLDNDNPYTFDFLMENLWFPGFTMAKPTMTQRLLEKVHYTRKGIMLDIGHLMNTNIDLRSEDEACEYIHKILDAHGDLNKFIKGIHLHQSLSGSYVKHFIGRTPALVKDYYERLSQVYDHLGKIDTHQPMTCKNTKSIIERIRPEYLVYEHNAKNRVQREQYLELQAEALEPSR